MEPPLPRMSSKPPLITPSASPPPARYSSVSHRAPNGAPPTKRQRTATPRRTLHDTTPSSSSRTQTPAIDVQKERDASRNRLLDVWASLAERYCRDDEEDDIVDINTGEITTDNGFLRKIPAFHFGSLAAAADEETEAEEEEDDEFDLDELDAWGDADSDGLDLGANDSGKVLPPVTFRDPVDAADLREFLEAEKQRKWTFDEATDEDTGSENGAHEGNEDEPDHEEDDVTALSAPTGPVTGATQEMRAGSSQSIPHGDGIEEGYSDYLVPLELYSEDELDDWKEDESNVIQFLAKEEQQLVVHEVDDIHSDSDIEIIDGPYLPRPSAVDKPKPKEQPRPSSPPRPKNPPLQLFTPPRSSSSIPPTSSPIIISFSPVRSPDGSQNEHSILSPPKVVPKIKRATSKVAKLLDEGSVRATPPKLDLARVRRHKTPQRHPSTAPNQSNDVGGSSPLPSSPQSSPRKLKLVVEVTPLKALKNYNSPTKRLEKSAASSITTQEGKEEIGTTLSSPKPKGKGKQKGNAATLKPTTNCSSKKPFSVTEVAPSQRQTSPSIDTHEADNGSAQEKPRPSRKNVASVPCNAEASGSTSTIANITQRRKPDVSPRKRKRVLSDADEDTDVTHRKPQPRSDPSELTPRRASSRALAQEDSSIRQQRSPTPRQTRQKKPKSPLGSDDGSASDHSDRPKGKRSQSRSSTLPPASHYLYPHGPYMPLPHHPPQGYSIPDPRAQLIIAQAMHQLSTLVGAPWPPIPSYLDGEVPHTPSRRSQSMQPKNPPFSTPAHHGHPYAYGFDPSFSRATLPPDSPEEHSSPEKSNRGRPKSLVRRSRSRGRRVSFHVEDDDFIEMEERPSSPMMGSSPLRGKTSKAAGRSTSKGKAKADLRYDDDPDDDESEEEVHQRKRSSRGQTPGPSSDPPDPRKSGRG